MSERQAIEAIRKRHENRNSRQLFITESEIMHEDIRELLNSHDQLVDAEALTDARNKQLCRALKRYREHKRTCCYWTAESLGPICNCGYSVALKAAEENTPC